jgi:hypothetical protein
VFVLNLPIAAASAALALRTVRRSSETIEGGLDLPGQTLGAAALALLAAGAIEGGRHGFTSGLVLGLFAGGAVSLAGFLTVEHTRARPMLPLGYFRRPAYAAANADGLVMGFVTIGVLFVFALFFQQVHGDSALIAGLKFLPLTVVFVLIGPLVGRLLDRVGHRVPMATGCALLAVSMFLLLRAGADTGYGPVSWPFAILGLGYGLVSTPMAAAVLAAVPASRAGMASSTNLTARLVGGVYGIAVLGALLPATASSGGPAFGHAFTAGLHTALVVAGIVAATGAGTSAAFIRKPRPPQPADAGPA